jgi:hypothetical protein
MNPRIFALLVLVLFLSCSFTFQVSADSTQTTQPLEQSSFFRGDLGPQGEPNFGSSEEVMNRHSNPPFALESTNEACEVDVEDASEQRCTSPDPWMKSLRNR